MYIKIILLCIGVFSIYNLLLKNIYKYKSKIDISLIQKIIIKYFLLLNNKYAEIYLYLKKIYNSNVVFRMIIDNANKLILKTKSLIYNFKLEPDDEIWISKYFYCKKNNIFHENYTYFNNNIFINDIVVDNNENSNIILKYNNNYIVRRKIDNSELCNFKINTCSIYFLSVEYIHPKQKNSIVLNIPKTMYITGNELFTINFIIRCLKYQPEIFYFDLNYKIKIIDININIIELKSNEYIILHKNNYIINTIT